MTDLPRILLTSGEPAGIGPDLCVEIASKNWPCELIVVGDKQMLETRARMLGRAITVVDYVRVHPDQRANALLIANINAATPAVPGKLDRANASYVLETLKFAADGCMRGDFDAVVTAPVQKSIINDAGIPFSGHTEFFAEQTGGSKPVMMLVADSLRVALATTHLPLTAVSAAITRASLEEIIRIIDRDLRTRFGIAAPRVLVCGLNPHAGEGGHLGREEIEVIEPVLAALRTQGFMLIGPAPADTAFTPRMLAQADCVLAMYHDQGLPVLKHAGFGYAVNVTLGLSIIRTSVDHGTALDLAGTGKAEVGSLEAALKLAIQLANLSRHGTRDPGRE